VKRRETVFAAARAEELTAVDTIAARKFPGILLPAPQWLISFFFFFANILRQEKMHSDDPDADSQHIEKSD